jgi:hypothetical protein
VPRSVFLLDAEYEDFHNVFFAHEESAALFDLFDGRPLLSAWVPQDVETTSDPENAQLSDHMLLGTIPVFSSAAVTHLRDVLLDSGELLELRFQSIALFAYNATVFVDALREDRSQIQRFSTGRVMSVDKFEFEASKLEFYEIFKIPQLPRGFVFVTEAFVARVRRAGLLGFAFKKVWSEGPTVDTV